MIIELGWAKFYGSLKIVRQIVKWASILRESDSSLRSLWCELWTVLQDSHTVFTIWQYLLDMNDPT